jgi:hypothetical protein
MGFGNWKERTIQRKATEIDRKGIRKTTFSGRAGVWSFNRDPLHITVTH